jgi:hypothetical protein
MLITGTCPVMAVIRRLSGVIARAKSGRPQQDYSALKFICAFKIERGFKKKPEEVLRSLVFNS